LSDAEFVKFASLAEQWTGVRLGEGKRAMLLARLGTRLRNLKLTTVASYLTYLTSEQGLAEEKEHFIDVVTTHHTALFREPEHFRVLTQTVLPSLTTKGSLRVLSAACSTGEEVWTIGISLAETLKNLHFELHGTDISRRALQTARRGVYPDEVLLAVSEPLRNRWFMRSRNPLKKAVRVVPELRERAVFSLANLTESCPTLGASYEVIFLRNVLIYFDREMQGKILHRVMQHLTPNGWLFVGLSESADGFGLPLQRVGHSVYRRSA
jgi:chemotaxis protein methyltransferase CheR